jgi:hypothetical protein
MADNGAMKQRRFAQMPDVSRVLDDGGVVRFTHKDGWAILVTADGSFQTIDGRTYAGFLRTRAAKLTRTEFGSLENGDLVIEWRR